MSRYDAINLSAVPPPDVVEALDYETILSALIADMRTLWPEWTTFDLESDVTRKMLQIVAYRELGIRQRCNDATRAVMLAQAKGGDLDQIALGYHVQRQMVDPGDPDAVPPVAPTYEDDGRLMSRILLAFEALSVAGPSGAYVYHALSADTRVADVAVAAPGFSRAVLDPGLAAQLPAGVLVLQILDDAGLPDPFPGDVAVTILSTEGDGTPAADLLSAVDASLTNEDVVPLTDHPVVVAATRTNYGVVADLDIYPGPDAAVVRRAAEDAVTAFTVRQRRLGEPVTIDGLHKALRAEGVRKVNLISPLVAIEPPENGYAFCTDITVTAGGGA